MITISELLKYKNLRELDIGTHISLKNSYIYFQVSKSASSTVKYYLQELEIRGTQRKIIDVNNRNLSPHIWPSQLTEEHFTELLEADAMKKVTFVRNPFSRILSCYLHRIKGSPESPSVKNIKRFTKNRFDATLSFSDFINIICDQESIQQESHWRVQSDEIFYNSIKKWDFIGKVESIDKDLPNLLSVLSNNFPNNDGALLDSSPSVTKANSKLSEFYTIELLEKVAKRYHLDFKNFNYNTEITG